MRKYLLFIGLFVTAGPALAQQFELPIQVTDGISTINMVIGMRSDATAQYDAGIDLSEPPPPPADFLRSYIEGGGTSLWQDFRANSTDISQFLVVIDPKANATSPVVIRWDNTLDIFSHAKLRMKHLFPGQPCYDLDMSTVDNLDTGFLSDIPGSFFDSYGVMIEMALHDDVTGKIQMTACEDAYARDGATHNTTNFGGEEALRAQQSNTEENKYESLIRFNFGAVADSIISASLKLYPTEVQGSPQQQLSIVEDVSWTEDGLTWSNKPAAGEQLGSWIPVQDMITSIDVTDQARAARDGQEVLSVSIESIDFGDDKWVTYASREHAEFAYRPVIEVIVPSSSSGSVGIGEEEALPRAFQLLGNYPNPFNPTTNVIFNLRENAMVTVDVFDLMGRNLLSVPAQFLLGGQDHQIQLDATGLTSGTYLYRVIAQMPARTEAQSGHMVLVK